MDEQNVYSDLTKTAHGEELSPYFSPLFLSIFSDYSSRFKKERTKKEYLYAIASLCNSACCDFFALREEHVAAYFRSYQDNPEGQKNTAVMRFNLRVYLAFSRFLDSRAEQYHLFPIYTGLFSAVELIPQDMEFSSEKLPSIIQTDRVLAWLRENNDLTTFTAVTLALRCALTIQEIVNLRRSMFFTDAKGRTGIMLPVSDSRKGEKSRQWTVKVPDDVAEIIRLLTAGRQAGEESREQPLLLNKYGRPITVRSLQMRLREACIFAGVAPFTMNELRTLGIAFMLKGGASVKQAAEYTGTKNTDWFFRYNRIVVELEDAAADHSHIRIVP